MINQSMIQLSRLHQTVDSLKESQHGNIAVECHGS